MDLSKDMLLWSQYPRRSSSQAIELLHGAEILGKALKVERAKRGTKTGKGSKGSSPSICPSEQAVKEEEEKEEGFLLDEGEASSSALKRISSNTRDTNDGKPRKEAKIIQGGGLESEPGVTLKDSVPRAPTSPSTLGGDWIKLPIVVKDNLDNYSFELEVAHDIREYSYEGGERGLRRPPQPQTSC